ncbi:hypothetical Protein YC6258_04831 [Gynuella sunshinyii YC6258]|uniref:Uncharacterized protein n=1 Tax=Gynuella sunshinyii YC6258 TaxID=1445510 RepID=A0A0C5VU80_9GAMM|nr:hypothetical Protein YC6258_04831 [Gynuella sunshinyii YC6258]
MPNAQKNQLLLNLQLYEDTQLTMIPKNIVSISIIIESKMLVFKVFTPTTSSVI